MRVSLFVTCLVDQFWPSVATSTVDVLRRAGCHVEFEDRQTCCGQPAFNTGFRREARDLATRFIQIFEQTTCDAIVGPSGSCVAMVKHFKDLFEDDEPMLKRAESVASRTHEFASFLVNVLGVQDVGAKFEGKVTWHDACHGLRDLGIRREPRLLIEKVKGAELVELPNADACCGFGGTFSVKYSEISAAILDDKVSAIEKSGVRAVVSLDASCLMQLGGRLSRLESGIQVLHLAELLNSG